jgi:alpha-L-rhamnosidase
MRPWCHPAPMMLTLPLFYAAAAAPPAPTHLRVEGLTATVAVISEPEPRFSFVHGDQPATPPRFGLTQSSYHITVADTDSLLADAPPLWDSGDVKSSNCSQIVYAGQALRPFSRYTWTVAWTSSAGEKSAPATSFFETGPIVVGDWQGAGWLAGAKSQFRNEFTVPATKKVAFARAYVAAAGCAHIEVNGKTPQPDLRGICPWPVNTQSVRYVTHDITSLVSPGKNVLGMVAGSVMHGPQVVLLLVVKLQGESAPTFALSSSSDGWMATESYFTTATAWDSAIDWTKQKQGWSTTAFTPGPGWTAVGKVGPAAAGALSARALAMPLSTVLEKIKPISVLKTADGAWLYSFPKNL